jgi:hypothetical protein
VLRTVKAELEILWADLSERLPLLARSALGEGTAAGRTFRRAMVKLWSALTTGENLKGSDGSDLPVRASLIRRVKYQAREYLEGRTQPQAREKWREVHPSMSAWWRAGHTREGEVTVWLAMRWDLLHQTRVELPGVTDQDSLNAAGERFGVLDPNPPVSRALSGGTARLAVLSAEFARELLAVPLDDEEPVQ